MKASGNNIHWLGLLLALSAVGAQIYLLHKVVHTGWYLAVTDGVVSTAILCLAAWGSVLLVRAYPTTVAIILYTFIISTLLSGLATLAETETLKWLLADRYGSYCTWVNETLPIRFAMIWLVNSWVATNMALRKNINALENRFQQHADAAALLREAELFKLRQQLQPHFLYNSMNSISALIMVAPDRAQEMVGKLSDFLRSSVKREEEDKILIDEELTYIQSYLDIESIRFGDRLKVLFEKAYTDDATIPPFLLQPILENAIKFGLYGKTGEVVIAISIALQNSYLTITITNPYDPQTKPPKGTGFGLEGIQRRLYLLYTRTDLLETHGDDQLFTTILKIPQGNV